MAKKGLCNTCNDDAGCCFPRKSFVWQCEEFSDYQLVETAQDKTLKRAKKDKTQPDIEETNVE